MDRISFILLDEFPGLVNDLQASRRAFVAS
jgi:hypothetical protein